MGTVLKDFKQIVLAKLAKVERYNERIKHFKQNWLFTIDQKKLFTEFNGQTQESNEISDADQSRVFWSGMKNIMQMQSSWKNWRNKITFRSRSAWLLLKMVSKQSRKIPNWKAPGRDGVHVFRIKLTSLYEGTAFQLN